ncbi:autotransporter outer membrane beta-barrel domain-containing protein [Bosea psychrotolerans]|nr:autotransporter outer membrane beta-barrel domain-containing protein [Bosea psychrotolerans]
MMLASAALRRSTALTGGVFAVLLSTGPLHAQDVTISTPQNGANGTTPSSDTGTPGGSGGLGFQYSQTGTVTVNATVTGGNGGTGAGLSSNPGTPGIGGAGGTGLEVTQGGSANIYATVKGGNGGRGGNGLAGPSGAGGAGGVGLLFTNGGSATINWGVQGGAGATIGSPVAGASGAAIVGGGLTLTLGSDARIIGGFSDRRADAITFTGGANTLSIQDGALLTGGIALSTNTTTLQFAQTNDYTLSNVISGAGAVNKTGAGTLTLTGTSTYTGATTIDSGTLSVNGSIASSSSLTVNPGGTLGGTGTVGTTAIVGGTLAPGNSIGTLVVDGNLSFTSGSTYAVEVSPSASDQVNVLGAATLGGATVAASFAAGTYVAKQYTILNARGGVSGTFGTKVDTNLPSGFKSSLGYDAKNAYLNLTLDFTPTPTQTSPSATTSTPSSTSTIAPTPATPTSPIPNRGLNPNQTSAANALTNFFDRTGGIPVVFGSLTPAGLSQVSGEPATATRQISDNAANLFLGTLSDPTAEGRGVSIAPGPGGFAAYSSSSGKASALPAKTMPLTADPDAWRWSVWVSGFGGAQFLGADAGAGTAASTSRVYGGAVGADYMISPSTVAGFALGGGATSFNTYGLGSGSSDLFQAGAFIRQHFGQSYLSAALGYSWQDVTTDRYITGSDHLQARFNANSWSGRLEAGHRFETQWLGLTPYAAVQLTSVALPSYAETALSGSGIFALSYAAKDVTTTRSELGMRIDRTFALAEASLQLRGGLAWVHNFDTSSTATASFLTLPGASFLVSGAAQDKNALRASATAEYKFRNGFSLAATFEGEFAENSRSLGGKGVLRYSW